MLLVVATTNETIKWSSFAVCAVRGLGHRARGDATCRSSSTHLEFVPPVRDHVLSGAVVEPRVKLVDDKAVVLYRKEANVVRRVEGEEDEGEPQSDAQRGGAGGGLGGLAVLRDPRVLRVLRVLRLGGGRLGLGDWQGAPGLGTRLDHVAVFCGSRGRYCGFAGRDTDAMLLYAGNAGSQYACVLAGW